MKFAAEFTQVYPAEELVALYSLRLKLGVHGYCGPVLGGIALGFELGDFLRAQGSAWSCAAGWF
jgi:hypothetical protein